MKDIDFQEVKVKIVDKYPNITDIHLYGNEGRQHIKIVFNNGKIVISVRVPLIFYNINDLSNKIIQKIREIL